MKRNPLISIITVTFNAASCLKSTIESVIHQSYSNIEYIIIDGASTDGTLDIINQYKSHINNIISEPDKGIYDAMNKGFEIANGDFIIFLNAGDYFASEKTLEYVTHFIMEENCVYYGNVFFKHASNYLSFYGNKFTIKRLIKENICHQSIFYPKTLYKKSNYELKYRILADWAYNIKFFKKNKFQHIPLLISIYDTNGISSIYKDDVLTKEKSSLIQEYFGLHYRLYFEHLKLKKNILRIWKHIKKRIWKLIN